MTENAQKDALNTRSAIAFATKTNQEVHWYYAHDIHRGNPITDPDLQSHLETLNSGTTNQRLGKIPLVVGMPVMITQNYDVENGVVNGCIGVLKNIRYRKDANGKRYATSCIVQSDTLTGEPLSGLPQGHAVVLEDTVDMTFVHPHSSKRCTIKRTQLPIIPAFAMTAHKAQGQTMNKVIIDLENVKGTETPYVMVSRVTNLDGLLILRKFSDKKIKCRLSEDLRAEFQRLEILRLETICEHGSADEIAVAESILRNNSSSSSSTNDDCTSVSCTSSSMSDSSSLNITVRKRKRPITTPSQVALSSQPLSSISQIDTIQDPDHNDTISNSGFICQDRTIAQIGSSEPKKGEITLMTHESGVNQRQKKRRIQTIHKKVPLNGTADRQMEQKTRTEHYTHTYTNATNQMQISNLKTSRRCKRTLQIDNSIQKRRRLK